MIREVLSILGTAILFIGCSSCEKFASLEFIVLDNILNLQLVETKSGMLMSKKSGWERGNLLSRYKDGSWAVVNMKPENYRLVGTHSVS